MSDLISREAAIEYLMTNMVWHDADGYEVDDAGDKRAIITDLINGIDAVDAAPVVHARAVKQSPISKLSRYCIWKVYCKCSNCGEYVSDIWNYCPKCNAKLDGGEGNETD